MEEREEQNQRRMKSLVNFQLSVMYYESYCDYVVWCDTSKNIENALVVFERNHQTRDFDEISDSLLLIDCFNQ